MFADRSINGRELSFAEFPLFLLFIRWSPKGEYGSVYIFSIYVLRQMTMHWSIHFFYYSANNYSLYLFVYKSKCLDSRLSWGDTLNPGSEKYCGFKLPLLIENKKMKQIWSHPVSELVAGLDIQINFALEYKMRFLFPSLLVKKNGDQCKMALKFPGGRYCTNGFWLLVDVFFLFW